MRRVCLLRAINVSGQRKMKMAELRGLCEGLGYRGVETYLQSGNLLLEAPEGEKALGERISSAIRGPILDAGGCSKDLRRAASSASDAKP